MAWVGPGPLAQHQQNMQSSTSAHPQGPACSRTAEHGMTLGVASSLWEIAQIGDEGDARWACLLDS